MSNPSKQKGTGGETELLRLLDIPGLVRTPPATKFDLALPAIASGSPKRPLQLLATRPDRGQWLLTMTVEDFKRLCRLPWIHGMQIEVKRFKKFAHHSIFESKFGKGVIPR